MGSDRPRVSVRVSVFLLFSPSVFSLFFARACVFFFSFLVDALGRFVCVCVFVRTSPAPP